MKRRAPLRRTAGPRRQKPLRARRVHRVVAGHGQTHVAEALRRLVFARDEGQCQLCGTGCTPLTLQHRAPRGMGGSRHRNTAENLIVLCGDGTTGCHGRVEHNRDWARARGFLVPMGIDPADWPVFRFLDRWEQPSADGWAPAARADGQLLPDDEKGAR
ncbi:HNH endonuclease [Allokutzneria albata]|uniref:5-methylcytosine-specific restriction endonuclease McrA n=1 Tax=Allokutzneria albata TaxID=211114 RepID=A0A1H0DSZ5_ALLAB|nr:HNH endonuclease [Allokutzneria albata]SDN73324.1 5-methylcytosine-specific restriction endonuclease McrA [Allokutzneria albata]SDN74598.1 5-methylcytosine-specific restriction endonuclease McrA [Allokutzneria albata]